MWDAAPHTLYRLYDEHGFLLYIGITDNVDRRFTEHARQRAWWGEVAHALFEEHPHRVWAQDAERDAIRAENPKYNIAGRGPKKLRRQAIEASLAER